MNQPIVKFASVYNGKVPFCQWRILHDNHSFVHSIKWPLSVKYSQYLVQLEKTLNKIKQKTL
jgi:hypothetical protein